MPAQERSFLSQLDFFKPTALLRELYILISLEENPRLSQREMARVSDIGIARINSYIQDLIKAGLVDVKGESNRTMRYFLSCKGRKRKQELLTLYKKEISLLSDPTIGIEQLYETIQKLPSIISQLKEPVENLINIMKIVNDIVAHSNLLTLNASKSIIHAKYSGE